MNELAKLENVHPLVKSDIQKQLAKLQPELDEGLVLTQDNVHRVDKGAFTTKYPISDITNNFDQITRNFGANQT